MIVQLQNTHTIMIPLTDAMHGQAEHCCPAYLSPAQSESIYLNGLSILVMDHYLKRLGYLTRLGIDTIADPTLQYLMDTASIDILAPADATVKGDRAAQQYYGRLECRRVMPNDQMMRIPESVLSLERIGYSAIQFNDELSEATVLGYLQPMDILQSGILSSNSLFEDITVTKVTRTTDMPLTTLRSLNTFCDYLEFIQPQPAVDLLAWFDHVFQKGWELVDAVISPQQLSQYSILSPVRSNLNHTLICQPIERGKVVTIGDCGEQVSLILTVEKQSSQQFGIGVEFWPVEGLYLPPNLHLAILDENDRMVLPAQTGYESQKVELTFEAEKGDRFQVKIGYQHTKVNQHAHVTQKFTL